MLINNSDSLDLHYYITFIRNSIPTYFQYVICAYDQISDVHIYSCRFIESMFNPSSFNCYRIHQPTHIANGSVKKMSHYFAGRYLVSLALNDLDYESVDILNRPDGSPIWPFSISGSISHTRNAACCVIDRTGHSVGIDIQNILYEPNVSLVEKRVTTVIDEISNHPYLKMDRNTYISLIFSAKECLYKAIYPAVKKHFTFNAFNIIHPVGENILTFELVYSLSEKHAICTRYKVNYSVSESWVLTWMVI